RPRPTARPRQAVAPAPRARSCLRPPARSPSPGLVESVCQEKESKRVPPRRPRQGGPHPSLFNAEEVAMTLLKQVPVDRLLLLSVAVLAGALVLVRGLEAWAERPSGEQDEEALAARLEREAQGYRVRLHGKQRVSEELVAGRWTLFEAASL